MKFLALDQLAPAPVEWLWPGQPCKKCKKRLPPGAIVCIYCGSVDLPRNRGREGATETSIGSGAFYEADDAVAMKHHQLVICQKARLPDGAEGRAQLERG